MFSNVFECAHAFAGATVLALVWVYTCSVCMVVCHCTTNNRCASLHIHSRSAGASECVEEEDV